MQAIDVPQVSAIANWFGSSRAVADRIGPEIGNRPLCVVPFAGGMSELPYIDAAKLIVNDRHRHVINLARVIADPQLMPKLVARLEGRIFHQEELEQARRLCLTFEQSNDTDRNLFGADDANIVEIRHPDAKIRWAEAYFIATWMSRGGNSGTRAEFKGKLPVRYSPNGGGSAQRFWGAVASIDAWHRVFRRCEFTTDDAFDVLEHTHDSDKVSVYSDSPWPDAGDGYSHPFDDDKQRRLATALARFEQARVVVRFADHPLIRELYPRDRWTWITYPSRAQSGNDFAEVLILNGESWVAAKAGAA